MELISFVVFVDLVKACDIARHGIVWVTLLKIWVPSKHIEWIENFSGDFNNILKLSKEEIIIRHVCGIR